MIGPIPGNPASNCALQVSVDSILYVARHAVEHNKIFMMNLSAPFLIQYFQVKRCAVPQGALSWISLPFRTRIRWQLRSRTVISFSGMNLRHTHSENSRCLWAWDPAHQGRHSLGLQRMQGWGEDIGEIALKLAALPKASGTRPRIVVITQGPHPTFVACQV